MGFIFPKVMRVYRLLTDSGLNSSKHKETIIYKVAQIRVMTGPVMEIPTR